MFLALKPRESYPAKAIQAFTVLTGTKVPAVVSISVQVGCWTKEEVRLIPGAMFWYSAQIICFWK